MINSTPCSKSVSDCILIIDLEGRIRDINRVGHERLGYAKDEMLGKYIGEFDPPDLAQTVPDRIALVRDGGSRTFETAHVRKDGSVMPVEISARIVDFDGRPCILGVARDITTRKLAEAALRTSEANLRSMMDNLPYLTWLKDTDGRYLAINKVYGDFLRLEDEQQAIGKTDLDLQPRHLAEKYRADDAEVMASRRQLHLEEQAFDGHRVHWVETFKTPVIDAQGNLLGTAGFASDITGRKEHEQALMAAQRDADRANLAKSHFLAAASHDLRQPFQALRLYLDILGERLAASPHLAVVGKASAALAAGENLLHALLDVSKLDAGVVAVQRRAVAFADLAAGVAAPCGDLARSKGLEFTVVPSSAAIDSDPVLLSRLLRNLVDNAIKYTERGRILLGCRRLKDCVRIEVWDTGLGIPDELQERIFDDFYQVGNPGRDQVNGLGIGLAVVRRTAVLLGHGVTVRSWPGRGSVFAITATSSSSCAPHPSPAAAGRPDKRGSAR